MTPYTLDDADRDLRAALDAGNTPEIDRLSRIVDNLTRSPDTPPSLAASALWYAEQGLHVFPLHPGRKIPQRGSAGCKDATADPDQVRAWWTADPAANIGLATGHLIDAVDIDGPTGQKSRAEHWDTLFATIDADSIAKILTPRPGGMHLYVPAQGDGNSAGIVPGVDYRGLGGYVVAPPSIIHPGGKDTPGVYRFLGTPNLARLAALKAA